MMTASILVNAVFIINDREDGSRVGQNKNSFIYTSIKISFVSEEKNEDARRTWEEG